jgi:hypothetical protein
MLKKTFMERGWIEEAVKIRLDDSLTLTNITLPNLSLSFVFNLKTNT